VLKHLKPCPRPGMHGKSKSGLIHTTLFPLDHSKSHNIKSRSDKHRNVTDYGRNIAFCVLINELHSSQILNSSFVLCHIMYCWKSYWEWQSVGISPSQCQSSEWNSEHWSLLSKITMASSFFLLPKAQYFFYSLSLCGQIFCYHESKKLNWLNTKVLMLC